MSGADYKSCEVCGGKTFYDAEIYEEYTDLAYDDDNERKDKSVVKALCSTCKLKYELVVINKNIKIVELLNIINGKSNIDGKIN